MQKMMIFQENLPYPFNAPPVAPANPRFAPFRCPEDRSNIRAATFRHIDKTRKPAAQ